MLKFYGQLHFTKDMYVVFRSRDNYLPAGGNADEDVKITHRDTLKVACQILQRCSFLLQDLRAALTPNILLFDGIQNSPCFTTLIPLTLAYLSQLNDPEVCTALCLMFSFTADTSYLE